MKVTKDEFKKLQSLWYGKLKETGFIDVEIKAPKEISYKNSPFVENDLPARMHRIKQEYWIMMRDRVLDEKTEYKNDVHKFILKRYSDGARIKKIGEELVERDTPRDRKSIRLIIKRYEMAWQIKVYTPKELCLKIRKKK